MKSLSLILVLGCLCVALAYPNEWNRLDAHYDSLHAFNFKVALKPQNMKTMEKLFWEISNPKSAFYGNFLTNEQIADLISLPTEDIQKVLDFLTASSGEVCDVDARLGLHRDYIFVDTCAGQAKKIFPNLNLALFKLAGSGEVVLRDGRTMDIEQNLNLLGVPANLHQYIAAIHDVTDLPHKAEKEIDASLPWLKTDKELTINDMIEYFDIDYSLLKASTLEEDEGQVRLGVIEMFIAFSKDGLSDFQHKYNIPSNPVRKIEGFAFIPNAEANLDVQTLTSVAQNVHVWDFVFGPFFDFEHIVDKIMGTSGAPKIYSFSFGMPETKFGESKVKSSNQSLMKFGLGGYTFVAASGDSGPVLNPDNCSDFDAEFPGASPYVLSVGGTVLNTTANDQEQAWIHSSGGFSVYSPRPAYQNEKVEAYLKSNTLPSNTNGKYNTANRAYPDVSAFGAYEPLWTGGSWTVVGGTSGAAPQFAAILAMVNIVRYQNGLGPLGAVNQALYQLESVGEDVVAGMNYATSRLGCSGQYQPGFEAVKGWDASTGLGSPKFSTLVSALASKQGKSAIDFTLLSDLVEGLEKSNDVEPAEKLEPVASASFIAF